LTRVHLAALAAWLLAGAAGQWLAWRAGRSDEARALELRRRLDTLAWIEHASLALLLASGWLLMQQRGWSVGYPRWLAAKLGLVVFLVVPLEGIHAYVCHVWLRRGLVETAVPPFSKDLRRGAGMDEMIRALAVPLLGLGVPLIAWLSLRKPF
jgi:hypothetical protein